MNWKHQIQGSSKETLMTEIRSIISNCTFSYTRQIEMKGLGHAILTGETLIGDEPFAVILADDLCDNTSQNKQTKSSTHSKDGVLSQMVEVYEKYQCSVVAIEEVPMEETHKYGVIAGNLVDGTDNTYRVTDMVEKPDPKDAPTNMAIIGRYILTPDIFNILRETKAGKRRRDPNH